MRGQTREVTMPKSSQSDFEAVIFGPVDVIFFMMYILVVSGVSLIASVLRCQVPGFFMIKPFIVVCPVNDPGWLQSPEWGH
jgi:hypothetical protein